MHSTVSADGRHKGPWKEVKKYQILCGNSRNVAAENQVSYSWCFPKNKLDVGWTFVLVFKLGGLKFWFCLACSREGSRKTGEIVCRLSVLPLALPLKVSVWKLDNQRLLHSQGPQRATYVQPMAPFIQHWSGLTTANRTSAGGKEVLKIEANSLSSSTKMYFCSKTCMTD